MNKIYISLFIIFAIASFFLPYYTYILFASILIFLGGGVEVLLFSILLDTFLSIKGTFIYSYGLIPISVILLYITRELFKRFFRYGF